MKMAKRFLLFLFTFVILIGCGDEKSSGGNPVVPDEPSSSIIAEPESSSDKGTSSIKESSSSIGKSSSSSKDIKSAKESSSSKVKETSSSSKGSSNPAESSNDVGESSSSAEVSSSSNEEMESSSSSVKTSSSSSAKSSSSSAKSSSSKPKSSSSSKKVEESSSSEKKSSSSKKAAEIKPNNYYKANCPEGLSCKYVTTEFLNQEFLASDKYGEILDERDGQVYKTIEIGSQTWLAQNMNYDTTGFCQDDIPSNCEKYGKLYSSSVASIICPNGWELPDTSEWRTLFNYAISYLNKTDAGSVLKSSRGLWFSYLQDDHLKSCSYEQDENCINGEGTNELGFSAIPQGGKPNGEEYSLFGREFSARAKEGSAHITNTNHFGLGITYKRHNHAIRCKKK